VARLSSVVTAVYVHLQLENSVDAGCGKCRQVSSPLTLSMSGRDEKESSLFTLLATAFRPWPGHLVFDLRLWGVAPGNGFIAVL